MNENLIEIAKTLQFATKKEEIVTTAESISFTVYGDILSKKGELEFITKCKVNLEISSKKGLIFIDDYDAYDYEYFLGGMYLDYSKLTESIANIGLKHAATKSDFDKVVFDEDKAIALVKNHPIYQYLNGQLGYKFKKDLTEQELENINDNRHWSYVAR